MDNDTFDLTPDYDKMRQIFSREARLKADTILANLLPETIVPTEYIKQVQLGVLREFQMLLNSIDMVTQCTHNAEQLLELRELAHEISQKIITKADTIERFLENKDDNIQPPHLSFMTNDGYRLHWSADHQAWFDRHPWEDRDLVFNAQDDGWPVDDDNQPLEGDYIKKEKE